MTITTKRDINGRYRITALHRGGAAFTATSKSRSLAFSDAVKGCCRYIEWRNDSSHVNNQLNGVR